MKRPVLFLKAHVPGYTRRTKGGGSVTVRPYDTSASGGPHHADLREIAKHVNRFERTKEATKYDRADAMRSGKLPSRRVQERVQADAADGMRDAVHRMYVRGVEPGTPHHAIVQAGLKAFGQPGEHTGRSDPEGFITAFRQHRPG